MKMGRLDARQYNWFSAICAVITLILTIITICKASAHPPIYAIERLSYYDTETAKLEELNKKLNTGKYTLLYYRDLNINQPGYGDEHIAMLGKISK